MLEPSPQKYVRKPYLIYIKKNLSKKNQNKLVQPVYRSAFHYLKKTGME